jgi:hypothetical protein
MNEPTLETPADSIPVRIVNAVADATGRDPNALPPLYEAVDPDALAALVGRRPTPARGGDEIEVSFQFAGCPVAVSSTGGVTVAVEGSAPRADPQARPADE